MVTSGKSGESDVLGVWKLGSGETVIDRPQSHLHDGVLQFLPEAVARIDSHGRQVLVEIVVFGRVIGETTCVRTNSDDEIVYAQRQKRFGSSRFVKGRKAEPCSSLVVILKKADTEPEKYVLITCFVGKKSQPEPWDARATQESFRFWDEHALIWGSEPVLAGTETAICPWAAQRAA